MVGEVFEKKLTYPYEIGQTFEAFFEPLNLVREDKFPKKEHLFPDLDEIKRTQAIVLKNKITK